MARHPLALRRSLHERARTGSIAEHGGESFAARHKASLGRRAIFADDAQLALAFVKIDPYRIHGGWPPGVCLGFGR